MRKLTLVAISILLSASFAQAGFTEYAARCTEIGKDIETSRYYSLHIDKSKNKGILIAVDTDHLTEAEYGDIRFTGSRKTGITITMPSANAVFKSIVNYAGADAVIKGTKYVCDFSQ